MNSSIEANHFRVKPGEKLTLTSIPTKTETFYDSKKQYKKQLNEYSKEIADLQNMMYAQDKYAVLLVFQGMDTAGKDGAIRNVMTGINPAGCQVFSFKRPTDKELDHDFLWRTSRCTPERGRIGIFNRSYYEEVLVVRVHPEILTKYQRIPSEFVSLDTVWEERYESILNMEHHLHRNGTKILKFFLHISKEEQRQRFLARIDEPHKNWKLTEADIEERQYFDSYMKAYEECLGKTSTEESPWFIIPSDDKKNARLIIGEIILSEIKKLNIAYPVATQAHVAELQHIRERLEAEAGI